MPADFCLNLGGFSIRLIPDREDGAYEQVGRAVDFITTDAPEISLRLHFDQHPEPGPEPPFFDTGESWKLYRRQDRWVFWNRAFDRDPARVGVFPPDFRSGDIYLAANPQDPSLYPFPLGFPMGDLFLMSLLANEGGLMAHASGVIDHGAGYLFAAHGGTGKTTTARLWESREGVQIVNDDKVVIRKKDNQFRLYGTPWPGEGKMARADSAPLKAVFLLKQAPENKLTPVSPAAAAAALLARSFAPLWNAGQVDQIVRFLSEVCQAIPCYEYGFLPDSSAVDFVRENI